MTIYFYSTSEAPYGCFSNFSEHGIEMDGAWWPTTEHYFQAQKFADRANKERVRLAVTPKLAAQIGRDRRLPLRLDWEQVKEDVMRRAVLRKFETHTQLRDLLLATGDEAIVEQNVCDEYWGCGKDRNGKNMLGQILMETRAILRERKVQVEG
jgi:N-glycosidase YbiA